MKSYRFIVAAWMAWATALIGVMGLGLRSYWAGDRLAIVSNADAGDQLRAREFSIVTGGGRFLFSTSDTRVPLDAIRTSRILATRHPLGSRITWNSQPPDGMLELGWGNTLYGRLGFIWHAESPQQNTTVLVSRSHVAVPFWFLALLLCLPVAPSLSYAVRRRLRFRDGRCPACGYDIRASPGRCPECGSTTQLDGVPNRGRLLRVGYAAAAMIAFIILLFCRPPNERHVPMAAGPSVKPVNVPSNTLATRPTGSTNPSVAAHPLPASTFESVSPIRVSVPPSEQASDESNQPKSLAELAAQLDPTRTYVFLAGDPGSRMDQARNQLACLEVFARRGGRWRYTTRHVSIGQNAGNAQFPTASIIAQIRLEGDDLLVTIRDPDGTTHTRSSDSDYHDPTRQLLVRLSGNSGHRLEEELLRRRN